jgi:protein-disulfide isomerase
MRPGLPLSRTRNRLAIAGLVVLALAILSRNGIAIEPNSPNESRNAVATQSTKDRQDKDSAGKTPIAKKTDDKKKSPERRLVTVSGNQITLDVRQWPLLGKPDAKYIFVEMFDYTCPYCRATHQAVHGAMERYGNDLAIVALPVPLDGACNRAVTTTNPQHAEACEIARIAVAVWRVDRKRFSPFHSWLFESAQPRIAAEARQYAAELVGENALAGELSRPYAGMYIAKHVELYERVGSGSLPKLMFPRSTTVGAVESTSTLIDMIQRELGPPQ